jgi:hypothetical protein
MIFHDLNPWRFMHAAIVTEQVSETRRIAATAVVQAKSLA